MKKTLIQLLTVVLFISLWVTRALSIEPIYPDRPVDLRVTGTILPYEQNPREDLIAVKIFVVDKPWLLRVGKLEELTVQEKQRAVEEGVLLRQVRFFGPDEVIAPLVQPDIAGKVFIIEGRLDFEAKRFRVRSVSPKAE